MSGRTTLLWGIFRVLPVGAPGGPVPLPPPPP